MTGYTNNNFIKAPSTQMHLTADVKLAKRLYRLPKEQRTIILQLLNKCEYIYSEKVLRQHARNASKILKNNGVVTTDKRVLQLPVVKRVYCFIDKNTQEKLTVAQVAKRLNKSINSVYKYIYDRSSILINQYDVLKGGQG